MQEGYLPEGALLDSAKNRELTSSYEGLETAMREGILVEGVARLCDSDRVLTVDLGIAEGILAPEDALFCRPGETRKDVALITRVGKPVVAYVKALEERDGKITAILSRREAQEEAARTTRTTAAMRARLEVDMRRDSYSKWMSRKNSG